MRAASKMAPLPRPSPNRRGVALRSSHLEPPRAEAAPSDDGGARLVALEGERHVTPFRGVDQCRAALLVGLARILLVAREDHDHLAVLETPSGVQRPKRLDDDGITGFHVGGAAAEALPALAPERLALQHGVEMADEQHARALGTAVLGHQVARAPTSSWLTQVVS